MQEIKAICSKLNIKTTFKKCKDCPNKDNDCQKKIKKVEKGGSRNG